MSKCLDLTQHMPTDPVMAPAWAACLLWAVRQPEAIKEFRAATGNHWEPGLTGSDRAIDKATGADAELVEAFVRWFNANVWGELGGNHE